MCSWSKVQQLFLDPATKELLPTSRNFFAHSNGTETKAVHWLRKTIGEKKLIGQNDPN